MRGLIDGAAISFRFNNATTASVRAEQNLVEQIWRDRARIAPIECTRQNFVAGRDDASAVARAREVIAKPHVSSIDVGTTIVRSLAFCGAGP
ncbi:MAG: hypothetical protein ABIW82_10190 [Dokdonella sp.]